MSYRLKCSSQTCTPGRPDKRPRHEPSSESEDDGEWTDSEDRYPPYPIPVENFHVRRTVGPTSLLYDPCFENVGLYRAANHTTSLTASQVINAQSYLSGPLGEYRFRLPTEGERIYHNPPIQGDEGHRWYGVSLKAFDCGLRLPFNPLVKEFFRSTRIAVGQLFVNGFIRMNSFLAHCLRRGVQPNMAYFWYVFTLMLNATGFYTLGCRVNRGKWARTHSNVHFWQEKWLYVTGPDLWCTAPWNLSSTKDFAPPDYDGEEKKIVEEFVKPVGREVEWSTERVESEEFLLKYRVMAPMTIAEKLRARVEKAKEKKEKKGARAPRPDEDGAQGHVRSPIAEADRPKAKKPKVVVKIEKDPLNFREGEHVNIPDSPRRNEERRDGALVPPGAMQGKVVTLASSSLALGSNKHQHSHLSPEEVFTSLDGEPGQVKWVPDLNVLATDSIYQGPHAGRTALELFKALQLPNDRRYVPEGSDPLLFVELLGKGLAQLCDYARDASVGLYDQGRAFDEARDGRDKALNELKSLKEQGDRVATERDQAREWAKALEEEVSKLKGELTILDTRVAAAETKAATAETGLASAQSQVKTLTDSLDAAQKDLTTKSEKYERSLKALTQTRRYLKREERISLQAYKVGYNECLRRLRDEGVDYKPYLRDPEVDPLETPDSDMSVDEEKIVLSDLPESSSDEEEDGEGEGAGTSSKPKDDGAGSGAVA